MNTPCHSHHALAAQYVELPETSLPPAQGLHKRMMGTRYIEVFVSTEKTAGNAMRTGPAECRWWKPAEQDRRGRHPEVCADAAERARGEEARREAEATPRKKEARAKEMARQGLVRREDDHRAEEREARAVAERQKADQTAAEEAKRAEEKTRADAQEEQRLAEERARTWRERER